MKQDQSPLLLRCAGLAFSVLAITGCDEFSESRSLGTLERDRIRIVADSAEPITRILVREGDSVDAGDVLIQQETTRTEIGLNRARAEQAATQSTLSKAEAGPRAQQISQARARLAAAESAVRTSKVELDRDLALVERNLISQNRLDQAQGRFDETSANLAEARAALDELLAGTRSEEIDEARARFAAATAAVADLEFSLQRASLRSPVVGSVESLPFKLGERPPLGATVAIVLDSGRSYARVHVSEPLRAQLAPGSPAQIWLDSRAEPLAGELRFISADAAFTPYFALNQHDRSRLSYLAEIDVVDAQESLPIGIPVEVTFPGLTE